MKKSSVFSSKSLFQVPKNPSLVSLLRTLEPVLSGLTSRYSYGNLSHSDDLLQEGITAIVEAKRRYNARKGSLVNFASRYAKGRMLNYLRVVKRWHREIPDTQRKDIDNVGQTADECHSLDEDMADGDAHQRILGLADSSFVRDAVVRSLSLREQQVIQLKYWQDIPSVEVARRLCISSPRVTQIHQQALTKLRHALSSKDIL